MHNGKSWRGFLVASGLALATLIVGQAVAFAVAPKSWRSFAENLPVIVSMIAFWGPIVGLIALGLVWSTLRLLGFQSLEEIRRESVEENNPAPAIVFVGTLIASILFLILVIRP
ncbi:MAG: hypothetical protein A2V98_24810 [Planctomycetes bacterium RBG_16_64_12]|nr:MAG: hypothetical protein A2V98_24810 [Planctomycetes bacterium RBG_16_64_12]